MQYVQKIRDEELQAMRAERLAKARGAVMYKSIASDGEEADSEEADEDSAEDSARDMVDVK